MTQHNDTISLAVPVKSYGDLATAAALNDIDISTWLARGIRDYARSRRGTAATAPEPAAPSYRPSEADLLALSGHPEA